MKRRVFLVASLGAAIAAPVAIRAQPMAGNRTLGVLLSESRAGQESRVAALRRGLKDLGYQEGKTIILEIRSAEGEYARLPGLAQELVRKKVDVLVAFGSKAVLAAREAAGAIPIVAPVLGDPVAIGVTKSLARPDGNVTGSAILTLELFAKHIELLKELAPRVSRVAMLVNPANTTSATEASQQAIRRAATAARVELRQFEVRSKSDFAGVFAALERGRFDAVYVWSDTLFRANAVELARLVNQQRLPSAGTREFAEAGFLVGYGADDSKMYERGAYFIDRLLKGAKVADLPIEQASRFELLLNGRTAKALGLAIPQSMALRADRVIE